MVTVVLRLLVTCILLAAFAPASVADTEEAKREYQLGWKHLQKQRYQKALNHYQVSYELVARPRTLYNIAVCEEKLKRYADALLHYQEFLNTAEARDGSFLRSAREKLKALEKRIGGILRIETEPSGASIEIDGVLRGHAPLKLALVAGSHQLRVKRRGAKLEERVVEVPIGSDRTEYFRLSPTGSVQLEAHPVHAKIERLDANESYTGSYTADVEPGIYRFRISLDGYVTRTVELDVAPAQAIQRRIRLSRPREEGVLRIHSDVSGARVSIDGIFVGSTRMHNEAIQFERALQPGPHTVFVEHNDYPAWKTRFDVSSGETLHVDLSLRASSGKRKAIRWTLTGIGAAALITGVTYGILRDSDRNSSDTEIQDRGNSRLVLGGVLSGLGIGSLIGSRYVAPSTPKATVHKAQE